VKGAESRWIVDPLDGTSNFLHGIPHWCISIALEEKGEVTAAVIYDPIKDEMFRAEKGGGTFMKNRRLRVSGRTDLDIAMLSTGHPGRDVDRRDQFLREYIHVQKRVPALRRYGAAALDLAYVAAGRFEGFWERGLKPWDTAAGYLMIREAGGIIEDLDGKGNPIFTGSVLAANNAIFPSLKALIHEAHRAKDAA
jgi:myo-inositol-1(or 4)-monophosphatase